MNKFKKVVYVGMVVMATILPVLVSALANPTPVQEGSAFDLQRLVDIANSVAKFLIVVSVIIAVIMIIWGGILWMFARGNEDMLKKAKSTVLNGIIGAAIVLAVGVILQTVARCVTGSCFIF